MLLQTLVRTNGLERKMYLYRLKLFSTPHDITGTIYKLRDLFWR